MENVTLDSHNYDEKNEQFFECYIKANGDWKSGEDAKKFRSYFLDYYKKGDVKIHSQEHKYESMLLRYFSMNNKMFFKGIKPIQIVKARFPMKTPLLASDKKGVLLERQAGKGGGIDIFTRTRHGNQSRINVIELKDEYKTSEPPEKVICQAIKYAVFIQQLLRSEAGEKWWGLFGFNSSLPKKIVIDATCVMPDINNKADDKDCYGVNDTSFAKKRISIDGNDEIELHYIYFKTRINNDGQIGINSVKTSL